MEKYININGLNKKYTIDEHGNVYDIELCRYKKQTTDKKGYKKVSFYINGKSKGFFVHRLVLMTFNPVENMEKLQVNHIDCNKKNNYIGNLEWCTQSENQIHAFNHGLISRVGEKNSAHKLSEKEVLEIAELLIKNIPENNIAIKYNVSKITISAIRSKRNWGYLLKNYDFKKSKYSNIK